jgi:ABC-type lipoprotein release transport system permease subunit
MKSSTFLYFLSLSLFKRRGKHIGTVSISVIIVFLLSAVLFLSSSLRRSIESTLHMRPDFSVTKIEAGRAVDTPLAWADEIMQIKGVTRVAPRIYGRYFFTPKQKSFLIVGIDFFDEQSDRALRELIEHADMKRLADGKHMIVGKGVEEFLRRHHYTDTFTFKTPQGTFKEIEIYAVLPAETNLIANDMIIMPIETAREIFGMDENEVTDITFNVPNDAEWDNIVTKLYLMFYDVRVTDKREIKKAYANLFNYEGGLFLVLYLIVIVTFILILYQRYSTVYSSERKEIGILRAVGWSINDVLKLKFYENAAVVLIAFVIGVTAAYFYVFVAGAPLLKEIFLGGANLPNAVTFEPTVPLGVLGSIFLFYAVPFLAAVLIPAWKIAVTPPKEAML